MSLWYPWPARSQDQRGGALARPLIVVGIIAALAAIAIPRYESLQESYDLSAPISELLIEQKIAATPKGAGIRVINLELANLTEERLRVEIPAGTYFVARAAATQNMVATAATEVVLSPAASQAVRVPVACGNRAKDVPTAADLFDIDPTATSDDLDRLMPFVEAAKADFAVRQAAVWIVTDDAGYGSLGLLVSGPGGRRAITEEDAVRAMQIVSQAGVDIRTRAIWKDRESLLQRLPDGELKNWLYGLVSEHS